MYASDGLVSSVGVVHVEYVVFCRFLEIDLPVEWRQVGTPRAVRLGDRPSRFKSFA